MVIGSNNLNSSTDDGFILCFVFYYFILLALKLGLTDKRLSQDQQLEKELENHLNKMCKRAFQQILSTKRSPVFCISICI